MKKVLSIIGGSIVALFAAGIAIFATRKGNK